MLPERTVAEPMPLLLKLPLLPPQKLLLPQLPLLTLLLLLQLVPTLRAENDLSQCEMLTQIGDFV